MQAPIKRLKKESQLYIVSNLLSPYIDDLLPLLEKAPPDFLISCRDFFETIVGIIEVKAKAKAKSKEKSKEEEEEEEEDRTESRAHGKRRSERRQVNAAGTAASESKRKASEAGRLERLRDYFSSLCCRKKREIRDDEQKGEKKREGGQKDGGLGDTVDAMSVSDLEVGAPTQTDNDNINTINSEHMTSPTSRNNTRIREHVDNQLQEDPAIRRASLNRALFDDREDNHRRTANAGDNPATNPTPKKAVNTSENEKDIHQKHQHHDTHHTQQKEKDLRHLKDLLEAIPCSPRARQQHRTPAPHHSPRRARSSSPSTARSKSSPSSSGSRRGSSEGSSALFYDHNHAATKHSGRRRICLPDHNNHYREQNQNPQREVYLSLSHDEQRTFWRSVVFLVREEAQLLSKGHVDDATVWLERRAAASEVLRSSGDGGGSSRTSVTRISSHSGGSAVHFRESLLLPAALSSSCRGFGGGSSLLRSSMSGRRGGGGGQGFSQSRVSAVEARAFRLNKHLLHESDSSFSSSEDDEDTNETVMGEHDGDDDDEDCQRDGNNDDRHGKVSQRRNDGSRGGDREENSNEEMFAAPAEHPAFAGLHSSPTLPQWVDMPLSGGEEAAAAAAGTPAEQGMKDATPEDMADRKEGTEKRKSLRARDDTKKTTDHKSADKKKKHRVSFAKKALRLPRIPAKILVAFLELCRERDAYFKSSGEAIVTTPEQREFIIKLLEQEALSAAKSYEGEVAQPNSSADAQKSGARSDMAKKTDGETIKESKREDEGAAGGGEGRDEPKQHHRRHHKHHHRHHHQKGAENANAVVINRSDFLVRYLHATHATRVEALRSLAGRRYDVALWLFGGRGVSSHKSVAARLFGIIQMSNGSSATTTAPDSSRRSNTNTTIEKGKSNRHNEETIYTHDNSHKSNSGERVHFGSEDADTTKRGVRRRPAVVRRSAVRTSPKLPHAPTPTSITNARAFGREEEEGDDGEEFDNRGEGREKRSPSIAACCNYRRGEENGEEKEEQQYLRHHVSFAPTVVTFEAAPAPSFSSSTSYAGSSINPPASRSDKDQGHDRRFDDESKGNNTKQRKRKGVKNKKRGGQGEGDKKTTTATKGSKPRVAPTGLAGFGRPLELTNEEVDAICNVLIHAERIDHDAGDNNNNTNTNTTFFDGNAQRDSCSSTVSPFTCPIADVGGGGVGVGGGGDEGREKAVYLQPYYYVTREEYSRVFNARSMRNVLGCSASLSYSQGDPFSSSPARKRKKALLPTCGRVMLAYKEQMLDFLFGLRVEEVEYDTNNSTAIDQSPSSTPNKSTVKKGSDDEGKVEEKRFYLPDVSKRMELLMAMQHHQSFAAEGNALDAASSNIRDFMSIFSLDGESKGAGGDGAASSVTSATLLSSSSAFSPDTQSFPPTKTQNDNNDGVGNKDRPDFIFDYSNTDVEGARFDEESLSLMRRLLVYSVSGCDEVVMAATQAAAVKRARAARSGAHLMRRRRMRTREESNIRPFSSANDGKSANVKEQRKKLAEEEKEEGSAFDQKTPPPPPATLRGPTNTLSSILKHYKYNSETVDDGDWEEGDDDHSNVNESSVDERNNRHSRGARQDAAIEAIAMQNKNDTISTRNNKGEEGNTCSSGENSIVSAAPVDRRSTTKKKVPYYAMQFLEAIDTKARATKDILDPLEVTLYLFPQEEMSVGVVKTLVHMTDRPPITTHFALEYCNIQSKRETDIHSLVLFIPLLVLFIVFLMSGRGLSSDSYIAFGMAVGYQQAALNIPYPVCGLGPRPPSPPPPAGSTSKRIIRCSPTETTTLSEIVRPTNLVSVLAGFIPTVLWPSPNLNEDASATKVSETMSPVGAVRIRQHRVKEFVEGDVPATVPDTLPNYITVATDTRYPPFNKAREERKALHQAAANNPIIQAVTGLLYDGSRYASCDELNATVQFLGQTVWFDCNGYAAQIPFRSTRQEYETVVQELLGSDWVDRQTRAVIVEYLLFHEISGMLVLVKHLFELPAGGQLRHSSLSRPFFLNVNDDRLSPGVFVCYILFVIIFSYYTIQHVLIFAFGLTQLVKRGSSSSSSDGIGGPQTKRVAFKNILKHWSHRLTSWSFLLSRFFEGLTALLVVANIGLFLFLAVMFRGVSWNREAKDAVWQLEYYPASMEFQYQEFENYTIIAVTNIIISIVLLIRLTQYIPGFAAVVGAIKIAIFPLVQIFTYIVFLMFGFGFLGTVVWGHYIYAHRSIIQSTNAFKDALWLAVDLGPLQASDQIAFSHMFVIFFDWVILVFFYASTGATLASAFGLFVSAQYDTTTLRAVVATDPHRTLQRHVPLSAAYRLLGFLLLSIIPSKWRIGIFAKYDDYSYHNYFQCLERDLSLVDAGAGADASRRGGSVLTVDVFSSSSARRRGAERFSAAIRMLTLIRQISVPNVSDPSFKYAYGEAAAGLLKTEGEDEDREANHKSEYNSEQRTCGRKRGTNVKDKKTDEDSNGHRSDSSIFGDSDDDFDNDNDNDDDHDDPNDEDEEAVISGSDEDVASRCVRRKSPSSSTVIAHSSLSLSLSTSRRLDGSKCSRKNKGRSSRGGVATLLGRPSASIMGTSMLFSRSDRGGGGGAVISTRVPSSSTSVLPSRHEDGESPLLLSDESDGNGSAGKMHMPLLNTSTIHNNFPSSTKASAPLYAVGRQSGAAPAAGATILLVMGRGREGGGTWLVGGLPGDASTRLEGGIVKGGGGGGPLGGVSGAGRGNTALRIQKRAAASQDLKLPSVYDYIESDIFRSHVDYLLAMTLFVHVPQDRFRVAGLSLLEDAASVYHSWMGAVGARTVCPEEADISALEALASSVIEEGTIPPRRVIIPRYYHNAQLMPVGTPLPTSKGEFDGDEGKANANTCMKPNDSSSENRSANVNQTSSASAAAPFPPTVINTTDDLVDIMPPSRGLTTIGTAAEILPPPLHFDSSVLLDDVSRSTEDASSATMTTKKNTGEGGRNDDESVENKKKEIRNGGDVLDGESETCNEEDAGDEEEPFDVMYERNQHAVEAIIPNGYLHRRLFLSVMGCADVNKYFFAFPVTVSSSPSAPSAMSPQGFVKSESTSSAENVSGEGPREEKRPRKIRVFFSEVLFFRIATDLALLPREFNFPMFFYQSGVSTAASAFPNVPAEAFLPAIQLEFRVQCLGHNFFNSEMVAFDKEAHRIAQKLARKEALEAILLDESSSFLSADRAPLDTFIDERVSRSRTVQREKVKESQRGVGNKGGEEVKTVDDRKTDPNETISDKEKRRRRLLLRTVRPRQFLTEDEFLRVYSAAIGGDNTTSKSLPSTKELGRLRAIFPSSLFDWQLFALSCQCNPFSEVYRSFEAHFSKSMVNHDEFFLWLVVHVPLMICVFLFAFIDYEGDYVNSSLSLRQSFAPDDSPAWSTNQIYDWLRRIGTTVWEESTIENISNPSADLWLDPFVAATSGAYEEGFARLHQGANYYLRSMRLMQLRIKPIPSKQCERQWRSYFGYGKEPSERVLRWPDGWGSASDTVRQFYASRVARDFPNTYTNNCLSGWDFGTHESENNYAPSQPTVSSNVSEAFIFRKENRHQSQTYDLTYAFQAYYPPRGFFIDIPFNIEPSDAKGRIEELITSGWIDDRTRLVMVKFVTYNANLKLYVNTRVGYEITAGGIIAPFSRVLTFNNSLMTNAQAIIVSIILWIFIFGFFFLRGRHVFHARRVWWPHIEYPLLQGLREEILNFPALYDFVVVSITIIVWLWRVYARFHRAQDNLDSDNDGPSSGGGLDGLYPRHFEWVCAVNDLMRIFEGINLFMYTARFIFVVTSALKLDVVQRAFVSVMKSLLTILIIFLTALVLLAFCEMLFWGHILYDAHSFQSAFIRSMVGTTLGGSIQDGMARYREIATPIFQSIFFLICFVCLFQMWMSVMLGGLGDVAATQYDASLATAAARAYGHFERLASEEAALYRWSFFELLSASDVYLEVMYYIRALKRFARRMLRGKLNSGAFFWRRLRFSSSSFLLKKNDRGGGGEASSTFSVEPNEPINTNLQERSTRRRRQSRTVHSVESDGDDDEHEFLNTIERYCYSQRTFWQSMHAWWFAVDVGAPRDVAEAAGKIFTVQALAFADLFLSGGDAKRIARDRHRLYRNGEEQGEGEGEGGPLLRMLTPSSILQRPILNINAIDAPAVINIPSSPLLVVRGTSDGPGSGEAEEHEDTGMVNRLFSSSDSPEGPHQEEEVRNSISERKRGLNHKMLQKEEASTKNEASETLIEKAGKGETSLNQGKVLDSKIRNQNTAHDRSTDDDLTVFRRAVHTYGRFRRLPIWNEYLFTQFRGAYVNVRDNLIDIPAALFGADGEKLWLRALEDKHYYELDRQMYAQANPWGSGGANDADVDVDGSDCGSDLGE